MSRGYPVEQWVEWIEQQKTSGLTVAAFCESVGVSQNAFYWRCRRLTEQQTARSQSSGHKSDLKPEPSRLIAVPLQPAR